MLLNVYSIYRIYPYNSSLFKSLKKEPILELLVEVKSKNKKISNNLKYFTKKLSPKYSFQIVFEDKIDFEENWIRVMSASKFLSAFV